MHPVYAIDYRWWTYVHLIGVAAFLISHGVSVSVAFRLRKEGKSAAPDRERIRELLQLSGSTIVWMYLSLAILIAGGWLAGSALGQWSQRWLQISLAILVASIVVMGALARPYYAKIKEATTLRPSGAPRVSDEDLAQRLRGPRPDIIAAIGFGAILAILWLMIFKPI